MFLGQKDQQTVSLPSKSKAKPADDLLNLQRNPIVHAIAAVWISCHGIQAKFSTGARGSSRESV